MIGGEAAESASIVGLPYRGSDNVAPRARLLGVTGNAASAQGTQSSADWGAKISSLAISRFRHAMLGIISRRRIAQPLSPDRRRFARMAQFLRARQNFRCFYSSSRESVRSDRSGSQMVRQSCTDCAPGLSIARPGPARSKHCHAASKAGLQSGLPLIAFPRWTFLRGVLEECWHLARQQAGGRFLSDDRLAR